MSSPNDVTMEEIPLEDDVRDSIEYKILMAYAQRRLSATKYEKLLKNEAKRQKSSSLIKRKVEMIDHQREKDGPRQVAVSQGGMMEQQSKEQPRRRYWPGYCLPFLCGRAEQEKPPVPPLQQGHMAHCFVFEAQSERLQEGSSQHQTSETADVNHIADKLAKLVTSRSQESPSDATLKKTLHAPCQEQDDSNPTDGKEGQEHDEEKIIQTIVSLLRQSGDQLEEKIKNDRAFYQHFKGMLSYTFFKRITDLFLEDISADSTSEPGEQVQCTKVALTMEVATRLTTVDNHPMNVVLGFGSMYLREHFKPWIQDQGGWEKALNSLDQEEVE
ncbi:PREDICTED: apoptosis facilitator Bcl-2-like protein 14 [Eurypyga helias]|uniref:apoptosis facilitator Bcl-2-like protein 14 n=1 Tax=Eurypyga helias TaxID=54383 RepID=UPI000528B3D1|nr:PREDICTED: apoptosis facilitator Bcl-2-like protein 14 [Eurypyga helias]